VENGPVRVHRLLLLVAVLVGGAVGSAGEPAPKPVVFGTAHPGLVEAVDPAGRWIVACQARNDSDNDGKIETFIGYHGDSYGDQLLPYLIIGGGEGTPIGELVAVDPASRYVVGAPRGRVTLYDTRTAAATNLTPKPTQEGEETRVERWASFDDAGRRLLTARVHGSGKTARTRLVVRELATGAETSLDAAPGLLVRASLSGDGASIDVVVVLRDTDGNGEIEEPRLRGSFYEGGCAGPVSSYSVFGKSGDAATHRVLAVDGSLRRDVPGFVRFVGRRWVRRLEDASLVLEAAAGEAVTIAAAAMKAKVLASDDASGTVLFASSVERGAPVFAAGSTGVRELGVRVHFDEDFNERRRRRPARISAIVPPYGPAFDWSKGSRGPHARPPAGIRGWACSRLPGIAVVRAGPGRRDGDGAAGADRSRHLLRGVEGGPVRSGGRVRRRPRPREGRRHVPVSARAPLPHELGRGVGPAGGRSIASLRRSQPGRTLSRRDHARVGQQRATTGAVPLGDTYATEVSGEVRHTDAPSPTRGPRTREPCPDGRVPRMRTIVPVLAGSLLLASAAGPRGAIAGVEREIEVGGETRSYAIHVPESWDRKRPIPVLFVFHGAGGTATSMVVATGFDEMSEKTNMVVVYPEARRGDRRYDVDAGAGGANDDVRFVDALLERIRARFPVDERRVWATGFSNGAAFCYRLAAERSETFAAIAPVAGYLPRLARAATAVPVPLIHVHGSADGVVGVGSSPVPAWARRNGATKGPVEGKLSGSEWLDVKTVSFEGPTPRSDARLLLVDGGKHEWSGGPGGPISKAILEFLVAHPRPDAAPVERSSQPLVGQPFGTPDALRWARAVDRPLGQRLTLYRWWTNACPFCVASLPVLARLEARWRARGLRLVGVYHPKGARLSDDAARAYAARLGVTGAIAFDDDWKKLEDLRRRGGLMVATSISVLVDAEGIVRWVHPGPQIDEGSLDLAALEALLERLLPASVPDVTPER
jgi:poly(3-hydroxybutyrate) depolymerase